MQLAISNLAWPPEQDRDVAALLTEHDFAGVELAPTKLWPQPLAVPAAEVRAYRRSWEERGLRVVALQALLFGRPDLTLFDAPVKREEALHYLAGMCHLAAELGAHALVFGSPKNRATRGKPAQEVWDIAVEFFRRLGEQARACGVTVCIEPNPAAYQCDFITRSEEGAALVAAVDCAGFGLHLDTGGMHLSQDDAPDILARHGHQVRHFHVSEPNLAQVGPGVVDHAPIAEAIRTSGYSGWVSVEMQPVKDRPVLDGLRLTLNSVRRWYGGGQTGQLMATTTGDPVSRRQSA